MVNLKEDSKLLRDLIGTVVRKKPVVKFFEYNWGSGIKLHLRKRVWDSGVVIENWWFKVYARSLKGLRYDAVILDIGAHIGTFTLLAAKTCPSARIFSFEPCSQNNKIFQENLLLNQLIGRVKTFTLAVSGRSGESLPLAYDAHNSGRSSVGALAKVCTENVETISLDDILLNNGIDYCDLIKMDCEGSEEAILTSVSSDTLKKIGRICMEYHPGVDIQKIISILKGAGFVVETDSLLRVPILKKLINVPLLYAYRNR